MANLVYLVKYTRALTCENFCQASFSPTNLVRSRLSTAPHGAVAQEGGGHPPLQAHSTVPSPPPPNPTSCPPPLHPDSEAHEVQRLQRQSQCPLLAGGGGGEGGRGGGGEGIKTDRASPFARSFSSFLSTSARALPPLSKSRSFRVLGSLRGEGGSIEVREYASATVSAFEVQALSREGPNINIRNRLQRHGRGGSPRDLRRVVRDQALLGESSQGSIDCSPIEPLDSLFPFPDPVAPPHQHQPGLCGMRDTLEAAGEQCTRTGEGGHAFDTGPAAFLGAQSLPIPSMPSMPSAWDGLLSKIKALDDNISLLRRDVNFVMSNGEAKAAAFTSSPFLGFAHSRSRLPITTPAKFTTTANFTATAQKGFTCYPHTFAPAAQPRHSYTAAAEALPRLPHQGSDGGQEEEEGLFMEVSVVEEEEEKEEEEQ